MRGKYYLPTFLKVDSVKTTRLFLAQWSLQNSNFQQCTELQYRRKTGKTFIFMSMSFKTSRQPHSLKFCQKRESTDSHLCSPINIRPKSPRKSKARFWATPGQSFLSRLEPTMRQH